MRLERIDDLLSIYKGHEVKFILFDDIFGFYDEKNTVKDFEIDGTKVTIYTDNGFKEFETNEIQRLELILDEEERLDMIYNAFSIEEAFEIAKGMLTQRIEEALDFIKKKYEPTPERQMEGLLGLIQSNIALKHININANEVLKHLLVNTYGKDKITLTLKTSDYVALADKIDETIEKIEKIKIF